MNQQTFEVFVEKFLAQSARLLVSKGAEYAGSEDRLVNFKRGAMQVAATPLQVAQIYLSKHLDSIQTYIRETAAGRYPQLSEPIQGRFHDAVNYLLLMAALVEEQERTVKELPK